MHRGDGSVNPDTGHHAHHLAWSRPPAAPGVAPRSATSQTGLIVLGIELQEIRVSPGHAVCKVLIATPRTWPSTGRDNIVIRPRISNKSGGDDAEATEWKTQQLGKGGLLIMSVHDSSPYTAGLEHYSSPARRDAVKRLWEEPVTHAIIRKATYSMHPEEPLRVMDIGCGAGDGFQFFADALTGTQISYLGIDVDDGLLNLAKEKFAGAP